MASAMTPREPDRFDAQAREFKARFWRIESGWDGDMDEEDIAAALRAEYASALERAAQLVEEAHQMWRLRDIAQEIRALIPPAAAPCPSCIGTGVASGGAQCETCNGVGSATPAAASAAETCWKCTAPIRNPRVCDYCQADLLAPAAEAGKAQWTEAREPNGLDDVPSVPASARCPICGSWETHQHRYDEVLKHRERLRRKARSPAAFPFDNGAEEEHRADLEILWGALTEAEALLRECEEWMHGRLRHMGTGTVERISCETILAKIAARAAPAKTDRIDARDVFGWGNDGPGSNYPEPAAAPAVETYYRCPHGKGSNESCRFCSVTGEP